MCCALRVRKSKTQGGAVLPFHFQQNGRYGFPEPPTRRHGLPASRAPEGATVYNKHKLYCTVKCCMISAALVMVGLKAPTEVLLPCYGLRLNPHGGLFSRKTPHFDQVVYMAGLALAWPKKINRQNHAHRHRLQKLYLPQKKMASEELKLQSKNAQKRRKGIPLSY